jgi:hypothetical protein
MRYGSLVAGVATVVLLCGLAQRPAYADAKGEVTQKIKEAMENYDLMDYEAAKKLLNQAIAVAKKGKLDKDPVLAKAYLDLGIVSFAVPDAEGAKVSFSSAVAIDPKIQIDAAYRSPDMVKMLEEARKGGGASSGGGTTPPEGGGGAECTGVKGLQHDLIDTGKGNTAQPIQLLLGGDVKAAKVSVMFRSEGATDFTEAQLTKQGDCKYVGAIPAKAMHGSVLHYYVAAYNDANKVIASKGSSSSPNVMELQAGGPALPAGDTENPLGAGEKPKEGGGGGGGGGSISGGVIAGGKPPKVMIAVTGGTGFGYVTGATEGGNMVQKCCVGNSLVVIVPELGFYVNPKMSIGLAGRIGLPIGANVEGHATAAPGAMLRVRYALSETGEGVRVMGQVGAGIMRNTIKLDGQPAGMDTDIVAQGPLLVGGGVGYMKRIGGSLAFVADFSAVAGIAVVGKLGTSVLTSGVGADVSLGLAVGF